MKNPVLSSYQSNKPIQLSYIVKYYQTLTASADIFMSEDRMRTLKPIFINPYQVFARLRSDGTPGKIEKDSSDSCED